jgi:hypothetical protein
MAKTINKSVGHNTPFKISSIVHASLKVNNELHSTEKKDDLKFQLND